MLNRRPAVTTCQPGDEVLPGYEVVGLLAHGRRVDTYDAFSRERDCRVVIKQLRPDRATEVRVRQAVILEGTLLTELTHPHLVRGYEVVEAPLPSMVLETLPGATLAAFTEEVDLTAADAAALGLQLCSVLGYLHGKGWLHLDLKPANVIVHAGRVSLIDLSLVGRPGRGRPGAGTRGFLAPEQALGEGLCAETDVWGLAVTLIDALTGNLPHGDEATWESGRRPLLRRRLPAPDLNGVPEELLPLLAACLRLDPQARPALADVRRELAMLA